jgi:hypothetical protein
MIKIKTAIFGKQIKGKTKILSVDVTTKRIKQSKPT